MSKVELRNCPHCGAKDIRHCGAKDAHVWVVETPSRGPGYAKFWSVQCEGCCAEGPPKSTQAEAITAWNTRTPDPQLIETIKGLVEALGNLSVEANKLAELFQHAQHTPGYGRDTESRNELTRHFEALAETQLKAHSQLLKAKGVLGQ